MMEAEREFTRRRIKPDTWYIHGRQDSAVTYLLIGSERALVIDPGENRNDIRGYIRTITDKPLIVAATHEHFDHTGSCGQFKGCPIYMSEYAASHCRQPSAFNHSLEGFSLDYEVESLPEGAVIDLGDREVETIAIGCHSPGSFAYLDHKYRLLFTGDEVESGQVLIHDYFNKGNASVERYLKNLKKLKAREAEFDMLCPAHNGAPMDNCLDSFIENCERILAGIPGKTDISSPTYLRKTESRNPEMVKKMLNDQNLRRSEWEGTSIVYDMRKIYEKA